MNVLMYHGIVSNASKPLDGREVGAEIYDVDVKDFREQMAFLRESPVQCAITFDDGEMNNFTEAFPILKEMGLKAYFFIIVKRVGRPGYMSWDEIKQLVDGGMYVGSHGLSHEVLTNLKDSQMQEELKASKSTMEANLGITIDTLSIPRGYCNDNIIDRAYTLGYKNIFISDRPACLKSSALTRIAVKKGWTLKRFEMAVNGKSPLSEIIANKITQTAKFILRESGYNFVRGMIIKVLR